MTLASQIELPERYRVARHIASGGMASVWEAEDRLLGRTVAVKVLGSNFAADHRMSERFQREARTAAQISDRPHVVTIYDIGEHSGQAFIVMEYFGGGTVADRIRAARGAGETLPQDTVLRWLRDAAAGLDVAHAAGIVHRDVKPANLMLDERDRLAVGDFGIARLADDTQMTQTGQVLGTAAYLSPEQALGQPAIPASDRYALAVVAYELLTGARPFSGGAPSVQARQHVEATPEPASQAAANLPSGLDAVLGRGLAKDPADRPHSATAFVDDLERALDTRGPTVTEPTKRIPVVPTTKPTLRQPPRRLDPPPAPDPAGPARQRRVRQFQPLILLGLAALLIGGIAALASGGGDDPSPGGRADTAGKLASDGGSSATNQTTPKPAGAQPATTSPTGSSEDPAALDAAGFRLIQRGQYAAAVPIERRAVQGFRDRGDRSSVGYAFALFNLGTALNRSGSPAEAIAYLEERLRISNDRRGIVEQELRRAQQASGATARPGKKPKRGGKGGDEQD